MQNMRAAEYKGLRVFTVCKYHIFVVNWAHMLFNGRLNKQLKQDMHTLMSKLKLQQESTAAVRSLLYSWYRVL